MDDKKIKNYFKNVKLEEESHRYYVDGLGYLGESVSAVLKHFYKPFPKEAAKRYAKKVGKTVTRVKQEWAYISKVACDFGTLTHEFAEKYPSDTSLVAQSDQEKAAVAFWRSLPDHIVPAVLELEMYHKKYFFGGTADILLYNKITKSYIIADWKTNRDLFKCYKSQKLLGFFNHLLDMPLNKYKIQLNLYQILLEQVPNIKVSQRMVIWLHPEGGYRIYKVEDYTKVLNFWLKTEYEVKRYYPKGSKSIQ